MESRFRESILPCANLSGKSSFKCGPADKGTDWVSIRDCWPGLWRKGRKGGNPGEVFFQRALSPRTSSYYLRSRCPGWPNVCACAADRAQSGCSTITLPGSVPSSEFRWNSTLSPPSPALILPSVLHFHFALPTQRPGPEPEEPPTRPSS